MAKSMVIGVQVIGVDKLMAKLNKMGKDANKAMAAAIYQQGEKIMSMSKVLVPVKTGVLRSSGHVQKPKVTKTGSTVNLGYGGSGIAYAVVQHEVMWYKHTHGEAKYLERPAIRQSRVMGKQIAATLRKRIKRHATR